MLPVAFLGVCDSSNGYADKHEALWTQDIAGLRKHVLSPIFPWPLGGQQFVVALRDAATYSRCRFRLVGPDGEEVCYMDLRLDIDPDPVFTGRPTAAASLRDGSPGTAFNGPPFVPADPSSWFTVALVPPTAVVPTPGRYVVEASVGDVAEPIGTLDFVDEPVPAMTEQVIAAIRADPLASKLVRAALECKLCGAGFRTYAAFGRDEASESAGYVWYSDLPAHFVCTCGKFNVDLSRYRRGLHGLLGRRMRQSPAVTGVKRQGKLTPKRQNF